MERYRFDTIILKFLIEENICDTGSKHIILSSYLTTCGFLGHNLSLELNVPHLVTVVGTDFGRGFYNPLERFTIEKVIEQAATVVALNEHFERSIHNIWPLKKVFVIHSSVKESRKTTVESSYKNGHPILLFSDCGFCHKKGTQILLLAFVLLLEKGIDSKLIICGKTNNKENQYWDNLRKTYREKYPRLIQFHDYLSEEQLDELFEECDIYCYPTISEGCSNSRILALCKAVPMVTTNSGEIKDLVKGTVAHIRTCSPGDAFAFAALLSDTCVELTENKIAIDIDQVTQWRFYLSEKRELDQWISAINYTAEQ